jgi:hypothetical protein
MPLRDLFKVTQALMDLLKQNIPTNIDDSVVPNVTAAPPDKVANPDNTLSFHLYHVAEDAFYKNAVGPGNDVPNVAKTPLALNLFYILTAHHEKDDEFDTQTQQKLMGYALKTFHDHPVVTRKTIIKNTPVLDEDFGSDSIQILLRPVTPENALSFWNSETSRTTRLSAYYEVRVVMLKPEPPKTMPGIVLSLGAFVQQLGSPHLERSQGLVRFQVPQKNGGSLQEITAVPARVTLDSSLSPLAAHNRMLLFGTHLTLGKSRCLVIRNALWAKLLGSAGTLGESRVDPAVNSAWSIDFATDRIHVKLAPTLRHVAPDASVIDLPLLPGFYTALIRIVTEEKVILGELKQIVVTSNEVSFAVSPRIQSHSGPDVDGHLEITLGPEFDVLDQNLPPDAIQVIVAGRVYTRSTGAVLEPREFLVANGPNRIRIKPHFPVLVTQPEARPVRVIVNGAESPPFWIELSP